MADMSGAQYQQQPQQLMAQDNSMAAMPPAGQTPLMQSNNGDLQGQAQSTGQAQDDSSGEDRKIFVGGLSWQTTDVHLRQYFSNYGEVLNVELKYGTGEDGTRISRGFAFVTFKDADSLVKVLGADPENPIVHEIQNKKVDAKKAIPHATHQAQKNRTKKIFVGGVPIEINEDTIAAYFQQFGEIEDVAIVTEKGSQKRRGFCFVTFTTEEAVDKCTEQTFHTLGEAQVEVKRATPRDQNTGRGGGRGGRGGGFGKMGWLPYGQGQYGGYGGYGPGGYGGGGFDQGYGGGGYQESWGGGGGGGGYGGYGGRGGGGGGPGGFSRYGPMKGNYTHGGGGGGGGGGSYHPYSR